MKTLLITASKDETDKHNDIGRYFEIYRLSHWCQDYRHTDGVKRHDELLECYQDGRLHTLGVDHHGTMNEI